MAFSRRSYAERLAKVLCIAYETTVINRWQTSNLEHYQIYKKCFLDKYTSTIRTIVLCVLFEGIYILPMFVGVGGWYTVYHSKKCLTQHAGQVFNSMIV